jgi:hypothetical protein
MVAFRDDQRFGDVIEISGQAATEGDDAGPVPALRPWWCLDLFEACAEGLIDDGFETGFPAFAEALKERCDVVLEGHRTAHTSSIIYLCSRAEKT